MAKRTKIELPEKPELVTDYQYFKKQFIIECEKQEYQFVDDPKDKIIFLPVFGAGRFVLHFEDNGRLTHFSAEGKKLKNAMIRHVEKRGPLVTTPGGAVFDVRKVTTFLLTYYLKSS